MSQLYNQRYTKIHHIFTSPTIHSCYGATIMKCVGIRIYSDPNPREEKSVNFVSPFKEVYSSFDYTNCAFDGRWHQEYRRHY